MAAGCELKIPSLEITVQHHFVMPNSYQRDGLFNPHFTAIYLSSDTAYALASIFSDVAPFAFEPI